MRRFQYLEKRYREEKKWESKKDEVMAETSRKCFLKKIFLMEELLGDFRFPNNGRTAEREEKKGLGSGFLIRNLFVFLYWC